jgi:energy-coupling factor transport system permease protein
VDRDFLASLIPPMPTAYHRLNPLTKAVAAATVTLTAFVAGGYLVPIGLLILVVVPSSLVAGLLVRLARVAVAVSLPIAISVALVSVFTRTGQTVLFTVGPFDATLEGADFAGQVMVRLFAAATALGLFGLTTDPRALVADIEHRGLPARAAFAAIATIETIPAMVERAGAIQAAQRARGLDTEGSLRGRIGGVIPLIVPVILSSLTEVEERTLALEVRAFGRPGRRNLLWTLPDSGRQRVARWLMGFGFVLFLAGRLTGTLPPLA